MSTCEQNKQYNYIQNGGIGMSQNFSGKSMFSEKDRYKHRMNLNNLHKWYYM